MTSDVHAGPLAKADPAAELHAGPLTPAVHSQKVKRTWQEKRWLRRRRRRVFEEALGWVLVPVILVGGYWAVKSGLNALGTTPTALIEGVKTAISSRG